MIYTNLSENQLKQAIQTKINIKSNQKQIYNDDFFSDINRKAFVISQTINEDISIIRNVLLMVKVYTEESKVI